MGAVLSDPGARAGAMTPAPFYAEVAEGPPGGRAWWVHAADGRRLRFGAWSDAGAGAQKGTVLLFSGRNEYVEKYGRVAADFARAGYALAAFDWRGQGLADRPAHRADMGHVESFDEYRRDVDAFRAALAQLDLPRPFHLIGHSLGGCIGLRALHDGLPVASAAFTGPMWGIAMHPALRLLSGAIFGLVETLGRGTDFAISTGPYVEKPFDDNTLTTDAEQYAYMARQLAAHPELALGGPSFTWVKAALLEIRALMALPAPSVPAIVLVGSRERVVQPQAMVERLRDWPGSRLVTIDGAEHELLMEAPARRSRTLDEIIGWFDTHGAAAV